MAGHRCKGRGQHPDRSGGTASATGSENVHRRLRGRPCRAAAPSTRGGDPYATDQIQSASGRVRPLSSVTSTQLSRDRKSTRLNSSHVAISYAVFCLTKKKAESSALR